VRTKKKSEPGGAPERAIRALEDGKVPRAHPMTAVDCPMHASEKMVRAEQSPVQTHQPKSVRAWRSQRPKRKFDRVTGDEAVWDSEAVPGTRIEGFRGTHDSWISESTVVAASQPRR
jgi:hypothetical protein